MAYKVFISHSTRDQGLVIALAKTLLKYGAKVFVAEWSLTPGKPFDRKVFQQIDNSHCVVVLLTRNGMRSNWVQHEIGYALKAGFGKDRPLIPLVEKGVELKDLGALRGRDHVKYDPDHPQQALIRTATYVQSLKFKKEKQEKALLTAGILTFLLLLSGGKR